MFLGQARPTGSIVDTTRLLLVQCDADRRQRNAQLLKNAGFNVRQADLGDAPCTQAREWPAGVVVTDLVLPTISGFELCRQVRSHPQTAEAFVLGVTEWTGPADSLRAMQAGFDLLISSNSEPKAFLAEVLRVRFQGASLRRKAQLARQRAAEALAEATRALARSDLALKRSHAVRMSHEEALKRIRSDYFELPGLRLTVAQGCRLWGLAAEACSELLDDLARRGFLIRSNNQYIRR